MMKKGTILSVIVGVFIGFTAFTLDAVERRAYIPHNNERIIFVGDSITGLGENVQKRGWGHLIREALETSRPGIKSQVVLLGGSGHQVTSWQQIEERSRTKSIFLDSKKFDVKKELDQGGPVLVIMLGMNDALAPYVNESSKALDRWEEKYNKLIAALRARTKPRLVCLATVTMCTEDLNSRKNKLVDALNHKVHKIALENDFVVAETAEMYKDVFRSGRKCKPDYHITSDYVHPGADGHKAIAVAMLQGLGKEKEAEYLRKKYFQQITEKASRGLAGLSYELIPAVGSSNKNLQQFKLHYYAYNIKDAGNLTVKINLPQGWKSTPAKASGPKGTFILTGTPDHLINRIVLSGIIGRKNYTRDVDIPAPWLIAWGIDQPCWTGALNAKNSLTAIDVAIEKGADFFKVAHKGQIPIWHRYYPSFNYTGKADPGSVDFAAVSQEKPFEAGYGVRWIYSPKPREVDLQLSSKIFAGKIHLTVWLNHKKVYQDDLTGKKGKKDQVSVRLKKGWNTLVFKSNRRTWQWQNSINLAPIGNDSLDDLRYSNSTQRKAYE